MSRSSGVQNGAKGAEGAPTSDANELVVFSIVRATACSDCGAELASGSLLRMQNEKPLCMECADLDHLVFLPRGDAALTRRSRKHSALAAVVVRFSRARGRYERQGLLVEPAALERAEVECLGDEAARAATRARSALLRERADERYRGDFAARIRQHYPACPAKEASVIADHACQKHSGRVGRTAAAKGARRDRHRASRPRSHPPRPYTLRSPVGPRPRPRRRPRRGGRRRREGDGTLARRPFVRALRLMAITSRPAPRSLPQSS